VQLIWYEAFKIPGELDTNNDDYLLHGDETKDLFSRQFCWPTDCIRTATRPMKTERWLQVRTRVLDIFARSI
jgi:hypothetical protein